MAIYLSKISFYPCSVCDRRKLCWRGKRKSRSRKRQNQISYENKRKQNPKK